MVKQITLKEALNLVSFHYIIGRGWQVHSVDSGIYGNINGNVYGNVFGSITGKVGGYVDGGIGGNVHGGIGRNVYGDVGGNVHGKINGRKWAFSETPKDKLERLITESGNQELIGAFNQMENNS